MLDSPGPAVLVHGDLHGDNQVWDRDAASGWWWTSRTSGPPSPNTSYAPFPVRMGPGLELLTAVMRHYQHVTGRQLSLARVMAWHLRQALWRRAMAQRSRLLLADHWTPPQWVEDLAARFSALSIARRSTTRS